MSGLLALLDDVAALAKLAAAQLDDIAGQAAKTGAKAAGLVIDDTAVTPKYVAGLPAARELPIVGAIALGSIRNKLLILLPAALALDAFAPWALAPLLMLGGGYLCFEGAEKLLHLFAPKTDSHHKPETLDAAHLERQRVAGAIKTDFILSAEIMTVALSAVETDDFWSKAAILAVVAIGITALIYGSVALLVRADDFGLKLSRNGRLAATRALGRWIVKGMPAVMDLIANIGTAAMLWVGGSIVLHSLAELGFALPYDTIHHWAEAAGQTVPLAQGFVVWAATALMDGIVGILLGFALIPVVGKVLAPLAGLFSKRKDA